MSPVPYRINDIHRRFYRNGTVLMQQHQPSTNLRDNNLIAPTFFSQVERFVRSFQCISRVGTGKHVRYAA